MSTFSLPLPIGRVTHLFGIRASALRYYEEIGLLKPSARSSGRRLYGAAELKRLVLIQLLRDAGQLSLTEIANVLGNDSSHGTRTVLDNRLSALERQIEAARAAKQYLEHRLTCPREDPVNECPVLDSDVSQWLEERLHGLTPVPLPHKDPDHQDPHSICDKRRRLGPVTNKRR